MKKIQREKVLAIAVIFTTRKFISPKNGLSNKNGAKRKVGTAKVKEHRDNGFYYKGIMGRFVILKQNYKVHFDDTTIPIYVC